MTKYEDIPCDCGNHYIVNRTYWKCDSCNYSRIYGKTRLEIAREKQKDKPRKVYQLKRTPLKQSKKPIRSTQKTKEKRKKVLEKDRGLYKHIFNSKENFCEECGTILSDRFDDDEGNIIDIFRFSHILGKAAFPEFRHNENNFNLLCFSCHQIWDFGDKKEMKIYKPNQKIIQELRDKE